MVKTMWTWLITALCLVSFVQGAPGDDKLPPASAFYVPSIPGIVQDPKQPPLHIYSGHLPAEPDVAKKNSNEVTAHIFFVLVKNRRIADKERVVFWFNGGPGCSSFDGLMMEVGPWRWDGKPVGQESFVTKPGGWEEYTTMVYIDQPPGTGFSYTATDSYAETMKDAQGFLLEFLKNFYSVFPEYRTMDTYLAGESYAGQWIPYFADAILDSHLRVPLKGVTVGNGWMDAKRHYLSYLDYATKMGVIEENSEDWKKTKEEHDRCEKYLETVKDEPIHINACAGIIQKIIKKKLPDNAQGEKMCVNMYDVRYVDTEPACGLNWPPEMHAITHFLDRKDVVRALHAEDHPGAWTECKRDVHRAFKESTEQSSITVLPRVLSKIPVMIFAGDQDLICNYVGLENMIKTLTWNGEQGLGKVDTLNWSVNGTNTGTWVESRNLTYVKIFNASHMAPFDVPHLTHDMMLRFMKVDFSAIVSGSAMIPSSLGTVQKPIFIKPNGKESAVAAVPSVQSTEQNKAMWEAYYNAGSAALVLVLILLVIGLFVWYRMRKRSGLKLPTTLAETREVEESIPLNSSMRDEEEGGSNGLSSGRLRSAGVKGKGKAAEPVFDVGSDDEAPPYSSKRVT